MFIIASCIHDFIPFACQQLDEFILHMHPAVVRAYVHSYLPACRLIWVSPQLQCFLR